jgi:hypothetical protein
MELSSYEFYPPIKGGLKANPPFNEMRQNFAAFKKETRMTPWILDRRIRPDFLITYRVSSDLNRLPKIV